jgi:hypothetical protein
LEMTYIVFLELVSFSFRSMTYFELLYHGISSKFIFLQIDIHYWLFVQITWYYWEITILGNDVLSFTHIFFFLIIC